MKPFSYMTFLFLLILGGLMILPEPVHAEDDDAYRLQESVRPRRVRRRFKRAVGSEGYYKSTRRRRKRTVRRAEPRRRRREIASYRSARENYYESRPYGSERDEAETFLARVGLLGGLSNSSNIAAEGVNNNIYLGLRGDLQYSYFGAEFDFYYGLAASEQSQSQVFLGDSVSEERSMSTLGGDASLKAQLPIALGSSSRLVPKLGAGYSLMQQTISTINAGSIRTTTSVTGLHGLVGFDLHASPKLLFSADFALGFLGNATTDQEDGAASQSSSGAASFNRLRAGAYYEIARHFMLGGQFTRREFTIDSTFGDSQNQFLGVLMYAF